MFPSWEAVQRYREVIIFVVGLMKDSRPLVRHVYEMQVEDCLNKLRTKVGISPPPIDTNLFRSLHADHPLHNKYINYYFRGTDTTSIYCPSRIYYFDEMIHEVDLEKHLTDSTKIPPCAMYIGNPLTVAVRDALLPICSQIWRHQAVTDLWMVSVTCNSSTLSAPRLTNPQCLYLNSCELPNNFVDKLLHRLFRCGETLQKLELSAMNFEQFESLLDELLEDLVPHHEAGLAQRKLWLRQSYLETDPGWRWMKENNLDELLQYILSLCYKKEHHRKGHGLETD